MNFKSILLIIGFALGGIILYKNNQKVREMVDKWMGGTQ